jgi:hypothetical protein
LDTVPGRSKPSIPFLTICITKGINLLSKNCN